VARHRSQRRQVRRAGKTYPPRSKRQTKPVLRLGCILLVLAVLLLSTALAGYLLYPNHSNILLLGIDYADPWNAVSRSDTIMLLTFNPLKPSVTLLSIPRDLWVNIPGVGENRINTAHFYAEVQQPGSGPRALLETIQANFDVQAHYFLRIRFESFRDIVDALGGIDVTITEPMAGYEPGKYHFTGRKALAFVRDRSNADDFFRMSHGQFMLRAVFKNMLRPVKWPRLPAVIREFFHAVDTNIPVWMWPRLAFTLLRTGPGGIDSYIVGREMVTPTMTDQGAMVLMPNWTTIRLLANKLFSH
jgi:polyisoprenyl-teichoic acid--peptidoglycan teichoic acid transferase